MLSRDPRCGRVEESLVSDNERELVSVQCTFVIFFFQAEDGIRDYKVTGVQTCALPISRRRFPGLPIGPTGQPRSCLPMVRAPWCSVHPRSPAFFRPTCTPMVTTRTCSIDRKSVV